MTTPVRPSGDAFLARLIDLERRLADLERAPRMPYTSQRGGTFELLDEEGRRVFRFGTYARGISPPGYGVQATIPDGAGPDTSPTVFEVDDDGLEAPFLELMVGLPNQFVAVTGGAFATIWEGAAGLTVARAVQVSYNVGVDAATTGEVRVVAGSRTSSAVNCPGGAFTQGVFNLLLPDNSIGSGPLIVNLQARRTAGAGNVNVYRPRMSQAGNDGIDATVTGL
jgi:hypothetical protein